MKAVLYHISMTSTATAKKLQGAIKGLIIQTIMEILNDPDFGLELTEQAKKRLRAASRISQKTTPLSVIKKKYGW